jgi:hypothetical protein
VSDSTRQVEPHTIPDCPVCSGVMRMISDRYQQIVAVCVDCHCGLSIPSAGWEVKWLKLAGKWSPPKVQAE